MVLDKLPLPKLSIPSIGLFGDLSKHLRSGAIWFVALSSGVVITVVVSGGLPSLDPGSIIQGLLDLFAGFLLWILDLIAQALANATPSGIPVGNRFGAVIVLGLVAFIALSAITRFSDVGGDSDLLSGVGWASRRGASSASHIWENWTDEVTFIGMVVLSWLAGFVIGRLVTGGTVL